LESTSKSPLPSGTLGFGTYLEQAVIDTAVSVLAIYCMCIAGTLTHDQTNPWEQENKMSQFACRRKISRTFVQGLDLYGSLKVINIWCRALYLLLCIVSCPEELRGMATVILCGILLVYKNAAGTGQWNLSYRCTRDKMENFLLWADVKEKD